MKHVLLPLMTLSLWVPIPTNAIPPYPQNPGPTVLRDEFENPETTTPEATTADDSTLNLESLTGRWRFDFVHLAGGESCQIDHSKGRYQVEVEIEQLSIGNETGDRFTITSIAPNLPMTKGAVWWDMFAAEGASPMRFTGVIEGDRSTITGNGECNGTETPFTLTRIR